MTILTRFVQSLSLRCSRNEAFCMRDAHAYMFRAKVCNAITKSWDSKGSTRGRRERSPGEEARGAGVLELIILCLRIGKCVCVA